MALHCALKRHEPFLPHEFLDEIARIAGAAELVDVRARIGRADVDARVVQQFRHDIHIGVHESVERELGVEVVGERNVDEHVEQRLALFRGNVT